MLIEDKFCNKFSEKYGCVINQPAVERWNLKFVECSTHTHSLSLFLFLVVVFARSFTATEPFGCEQKHELRMCVIIIY